MSSPIRILVIDDHTLFRRGLTALLSSYADLEVVGDAADAGEGLRRAQLLQPDIILLDNHLPGVLGVDAVPAMLDVAPSARVLILTVSEDESDLASALQGGAAGYLLKTLEGDALAEAIRRAIQGESVVAQEMTSKLVSAYRTATISPGGKTESRVDGMLPSQPSVQSVSQHTALDQLSPREQQILGLIAHGASNKEIGRALNIAETTVKIHVQHILRKLNVSSRVHAAVIATEAGMG